MASVSTPSGQEVTGTKDFDKIYRLTPRTFPYQEILPYKTETQTEVLAHLNHIIANIYVAIKAMEDGYTVGSNVSQTVLHWTRELDSWMSLKFDMPLGTRVKLARLYYDLALADFESHALEKIVKTFVWLTGDEAFSQNIKPADMQLRVAPLVEFLKNKAFPPPFYSNKLSISKSFTVMCRLANEARQYFDPAETLELYNEILPLVSVFSILNFPDISANATL